MSELVAVVTLVVGEEVVVDAKFVDLIEVCEVARTQGVQGVGFFQ